MKTWYRFEKASDTAVDLYIFDFIGDWIDHYWGFGDTAKAVINKIKGFPDSVSKVRVLINSPGGSVPAGLAIANALRDWGTQPGHEVTTTVVGVAASIASVIAMAGSKVEMADNALMMIHDPWVGVQGNAQDLRRAAMVLDAVKSGIVATYRWHVQMSDTELDTLLSQETYMDAKMAVRMGFATHIISGKFEKSVAPAWSLRALKIPDEFAHLAATWVEAPGFRVVKSDVDKMQVFGWASVAVTVTNSAVVDAHEHLIDPEDLEAAAYAFNLLYREADANHTEKVVGTLIESFVVTPEKLEALGLSEDAMPLGWWVGFQLTDKAVFDKVKSGDYRMFSIAGTATLEKVD